MFNTLNGVITSTDTYYKVDGEHVRHKSIQLSQRVLSRDAT